MVSMESRVYRYRAPGMAKDIRVTTGRKLYEDHPESVALWSPGSPVFPDMDAMAEGAVATPDETLDGVL